MRKHRIIAYAMLSVITALFFLRFATGAQPTYTFAVIGDTGCGCAAQERVARRLISWHGQHPFNVVLMLGDNVYGKSYGLGAAGGDKRLFYDRFDKYYYPLRAKGVKFYATIGNHDAETRDGADEIEDKARFNILGDKGYYAMSPNLKVGDQPLITFFSLNTVRFVENPNDSEQIAWMSRTFTESKALWKIVYFHHPLYAPEGGHAPEVEVRRSLEKLLVAAGVQVVLTGHNHYYARMKTQQGILHFVSGGGGRSLVTPEANDLTQKVVKTNQFMYFEVFPDRLKYTAIPAEGLPIDEGELMLVNPTSLTQTPQPPKARSTNR